MTEWSTGRGEPRLLVHQGHVIGMVDDHVTAAAIVRAMNEYTPAIAARVRAMADEAALRGKLQVFVDAAECLCPGALQEILSGVYDPRTAGTMGVRV